MAELVNTDEYLANFGDNAGPYQRRRILPPPASGSIIFAPGRQIHPQHSAKLLR
ncbi:MAG: hypothetical protein HC805_02735 [Alkalinema sp. RL_2_19]|nr:hypothetical protein [Alkalinema sp. RL_2_19]